MTTYWFKPKRYGYGATQVAWQGWTVTLVAVAVIVAATLAARTSGAGHPWAAVFLVVIDLIVLALLFVISRRKTDGEWRWRWGSR